VLRFAIRSSRTLPGPRVKIWSGRGGGQSGSHALHVGVNGAIAKHVLAHSIALEYESVAALARASSRQAIVEDRCGGELSGGGPKLFRGGAGDRGSRRGRSEHRQRLAVVLATERLHLAVLTARRSLAAGSSPGSSPKAVRKKVDPADFAARQLVAVVGESNAKWPNRALEASLRGSRAQLTVTNASAETLCWQGYRVGDQLLGRATLAAERHGE